MIFVNWLLKFEAAVRQNVLQGAQKPRRAAGSKSSCDIICSPRRAPFNQPDVKRGEMLTLFVAVLLILPTPETDRITPHILRYARCS